MCSGLGQYDSRADLLSNGTPNNSPMKGLAYDTITGAQIVDMVVNPPSVDKASARWVIPSSIHSKDARTHHHQNTHGVFWMIPFDFDVDPPSLERARDAILSIFPGAYLVQFTSSSATMEKPKSRAFVYLAHPIIGADYGDTIDAVYDILDEDHGIKADRALRRTAQLIYLPNRGAFYQHQITNGHAVVLTDDHPVIVRREANRAEAAEARRKADAIHEQKRAELERRRAAGETLPIDDWNAQHRLEDVLERYGYEQGRMGRWKAPHSESGSFALYTSEDGRWTYFGASMAGVGMAGKGCQHGDAFDLFLHHEHNGDRNAALRSLDTPEAAFTRTLNGAFAAGMPEKATMPPGVVSIPEGEWVDLVLDDKGLPVANSANVAAYIRNEAIWNECFAYDAFNERPVVLHPMPGDNNKKVPRFLEDHDYISTFHWFQRYVFPRIAKGNVIDAVDIVCRKNTFEPVQDYLRALHWDGVSRIDNWLFTYAGVDKSTDDAMMTYLTQIARKWLISAVARAMDPGCQVDHALVLEGAQGKGKSSLFRALCPTEDWFGDALPDFHHKDASEYMAGKWIIEMSELTNVLKSEVEDMRRFLTRRVEQFRPSYGRNEVTRPRRAVFCGSTNRGDYLKDAEGERRLWIARSINSMDVAGLKRDRDQIWAEAYAAYVAKERWHLMPEVEAYARTIQQQRVPIDEWKHELSLFLSDKFEVTVKMCCHALGLLEHGKRNSKVEKEVGAELRNLGWVYADRQYTREPYKGQLVFVRQSL
ncbi:Predicted P-loop ATPase and inactivated derivatives [Shimia aestuarii]|uniref:Predicted P-loop ATPase and inactivated derivatives n=2 Tax=Shimia aestuarii TaxID=254406 RepID=A0A1I4P1M4_9RHOB|nr:Predicted P-loop ATPase and inactivated derivatives [Shimia aestuarii]